MPAALLMSNLQASLQSLIREDYPLDKLVGRINNVIFQNTDADKYITFFYGYLDTVSMKLHYVNAGHNPPYLLRADSREIVELSTGGIILGMMPDMPFKIGTCQLNKDDLLLLYTDGVTEAMTPDDVEFEEKRLIKFLKKLPVTAQPEEINLSLIQALTQFCKGAPQTDDITILTLRMR